jgi:hypothetical protein
MLSANMNRVGGKHNISYIFILDNEDMIDPQA